jgi:HlyD family secretion protein
MGWTRWVGVVTLGAAVILAVAYGFWPRPVPVDVARVQRGPLRVTVEEEGKTRVKDRFVVSAPVAGFMRRSELKVGDPVQAGQIVVVLEPLRSSVLDPRTRAEAEAAVAAAEATVKAAEEKVRGAAADAEYAAKKLGRAQDLFREGILPGNDLDLALAEARRTEALVLSAEAEVEAARGARDRARSALRHSAAEGVADRRRVVPVQAPVPGRVLAVRRESAGVVAAGDPLVDIGDPGRLEVAVELLSADAVEVGPGTPVLFERWGGENPLTGRVRIVEPTAFTKVSSLGVEEQRVVAVADITSPPAVWRRLGDGYRVEARFIVWEGADVLQVPAGSLFRQGEGWALFVVEDGRARLRTVAVGHRNDVAAEVITGVTEGQSVVTHPDESITDGTRVTPRRVRP